MLDPEAVVGAYANADLHWSDVTIEASDPANYVVTDQASGTSVVVSVSQPGRTGSTGIWAVDRVGSHAA